MITALVLVSAVPSRTPTGYLIRAGFFQAEMLYGRVPLDEAMPGLEEKRREKLELVPEIKAFGKKIGLKASSQYDTINPTWKRTIYNVSASRPLRFKARKYWFPIVGKVPYLGFFRKNDAKDRAAELERQGWDVYVRTAGAYSTLGWFGDPVLPKMLKWSERSLANTILHELAHATVWIPGSVQFNESFANFVGDQAAQQYMVARYGDEAIQKNKQRKEDAKAYKNMLRGVHAELKAVYKRRDIRKGDKLREKHRIITSLPRRTAELGLHDEKKYLKKVRKGTWNNARLMQFRTYNRNRGHFKKLYEQEGEDLMRFMARVEEITAGADDPYEALALAVGETPEKRDRDEDRDD